MKYSFIASSMLIFTVSLASGLIKTIEFDETGKGVYAYNTDNKQVADAIRRHPLTKAGRIIDESQPEEAQVQQHEEKQVKDENVLRFENITKARTYLQKEFKVDGRGLKTPDSVKAKAKELGVNIEF